MSKTAGLLRRVLLMLAVVAVGLGMMPPVGAQAQAVAGPGVPEEPEALRGHRLERLWARQRRMHVRLGRVFDHVERRVTRAQELIDRAEENGKDVSRLQATLDSFEESVRHARPLFASAKGLINSHRGFDSDGRVTDFEVASGTVRHMADQLREIRSSLLEPARELRDAIRGFRQTNQPQ